MGKDKKSRKKMIEEVKERLGLENDLAAYALWSVLLDNSDLFSKFQHGKDDPENILKALESWIGYIRWTLEEYVDEMTGVLSCDREKVQAEQVKNCLTPQEKIDKAIQFESDKHSYNIYSGVSAGLSMLSEILEGLRFGEENAFTKKLTEKPSNRPKDVRAISYLKRDVGKGYRFLMMCGATQPEATEALNSVLFEAGLPIMTVDAIRKLAPKAENLHGNVGAIERFGFKLNDEEKTGIWPLSEVGEKRDNEIRLIATFSLMLSVPDAKKHYEK